MLEINNVEKHFKKKNVLQGINLKLEQGIYGVLGINGAGKTTLINIITGIMRPDAGTVLYDGIDIFDKRSMFRSKMGFMPQYTTFYPNFTAKEFLMYMCVIKEIPKKNRKQRINDLLEKVNLLHEADTKIGTFSGGMRQRLGIAQALINDPELLILDEPTAGLDPEERIRFRNLISDVAQDKIVILATHIVQDVEYIANKLILLNEGVVKIQGSPKLLLENMRGHVGIIHPDKENIKREMETNIVSNFFTENGQYRLRVVSENINKDSAQIVEPNLEDVFLYYTQRRKQ